MRSWAMTPSTPSRPCSVKAPDSAALTGPIARGDIETVTKHLRALPPDLIPLYKTLGLAALAMTPSNLSTVQQLALRQLLQTPINKEELPYE